MKPKKYSSPELGLLVALFGQPEETFKVKSPEQLSEAVRRVIGVLTERQLTVVKLGFGFDGGEPLTEREIGKKYDVSRERIRQIMCKALRIMRQRHVIKPLARYAPDYDPDIEIQELEKTVQYLEEHLKRMAQYGGVRISEMDFTVRTTNTLTSAGIENLIQLCGKSESDLLKFRNFGRRSLEEVKEKLLALGFQLKPA